MKGLIIYGCRLFLKKYFENYSLIFDYLSYSLATYTFYCIIPSLLMVVFNSLLVYKISKKNVFNMSSVTNNYRSKKSISVTVLLVTTFFIVCTAPDTIANGYFVSMLFETRLGTMILFYLDSILFTFHSLNFIVLLMSNKRFSQEVRALFFRNRSPKVDTTKVNITLQMKTF
jgi:hypothetical protein